MNRRKLLIASLLLILVFVLTGCTKVYEMTEEEEQIITSYAAKVTTKYNKGTDRGLTEVYIEPEEEAEPEVPEEEEELPPEEITYDEDGNPIVPIEPDTLDEYTQASLQDILGYSNLSVQYNSFEIDTTFNDEDLIVVTPAVGNNYYVVKYLLNNITDAEAAVDIMSRAPSFSLGLADGTLIKNDTTILLNDLSTYQGTIAPGESTELVLLFQVNKDAGELLSGAKLYVTIDDNTYNVLM